MLVERTGVITDADLVKLTEVLDKTGGHCPCVPKSARSEDTLCQCKVFRETGKCHCGYFA